MVANHKKKEDKNIAMALKAEAFSKAIAGVEEAVEKLAASFKAPAMQFAEDIKALSEHIDYLDKNSGEVLVKFLEGKMASVGRQINKEIGKALG